MLIPQQNTKLMSLLLVYLAENYTTELQHCNVCGITTPRFERSFLSIDTPDNYPIDATCPCGTAFKVELAIPDLD